MTPPQSDTSPIDIMKPIFELDQQVAQQQAQVRMDQGEDAINEAHDEIAYNPHARGKRVKKKPSWLKEFVTP